MPSRKTSRVKRKETEPQESSEREDVPETTSQRSRKRVRKVLAKGLQPDEVVDIHYVGAHPLDFFPSSFPQTSVVLSHTTNTQEAGKEARAEYEVESSRKKKEKKNTSKKRSTRAKSSPPRMSSKSTSSLKRSRAQKRQTDGLF